MQFVKLTHTVLWGLKAKGYNILKSPLPIDNEDPTWYPEKVDDIWKYLDDLAGVPFREPNVMVIQDALENIEDGDLIGMVWIEE